MERTALMQVTPGAKKCASYNLTQFLSRHKMHQENIRTETSLGYFSVPAAAKSVNASEHIVRLAEPIKCNALYYGEKEVTYSAKKTESSTKIMIVLRVIVV